MTAAIFPSKMMSTSSTGEFCGAAYAFWKKSVGNQLSIVSGGNTCRACVKSFISLGKSFGLRVCEAFDDPSKEKASALTYTKTNNNFVSPLQAFSRPHIK